MQSFWFLKNVSLLCFNESWKHVSVKLRYYYQKQPLRGVLEKRCSKKMQQICRRKPIPKVQFQWSCKATLLKPHFGMGVLLWICCIFWEHLFLGTPLGGCFCIIQTLITYCQQILCCDTSFGLPGVEHVKFYRFLRFVPTYFTCLHMSSASLCTILKWKYEQEIYNSLTLNNVWYYLILCY